MIEKKYHYVYKLTDKFTGEFYYGSRSCNCIPSDDFKYMGSMVTWNPDKTKLIKDIINQNFNSREDAITYESYLIEKNIHDELNRNYATPDGKFYRSGEPVNKGVKNPQHCIRMSGENNPRYGANDVAVIQYDKNGLFVRKWNSIREASTTLNIKYDYIKRCIFGKGRITSGYMWREYRDENYKQYIQPYKRNCKPRGKYKIKKYYNPLNVSDNHIPIFQYTTDGMFITRWPSVTIASKAMSNSISNINRCLEGKTKASGGFKWKYK